MEEQSKTTKFPQDSKNISQNTKVCPNCKNILPFDATECPRCGYQFTKASYTNIEFLLLFVGVATLIIGTFAAIIIFIFCATTYIGKEMGFFYAIIILLISFIAGSQLIGLSTVINLLRDIRQKQ